MCCRSPLIPARPTFSAEILSASTGSEPDSNVWTNPNNNNNDNSKQLNYNGRVSSSENRIPPSIQRELDQRKIGESITNIANKIRRYNSWENEGKPGSVIGMALKTKSDNPLKSNKDDVLPHYTE